MAMIRTEPAGILHALRRASPGDVVEFNGLWDPAGKKIQGVKGRQGEPVTLRGASQDTATVTGRHGGAFAARVEDCEFFAFGNATVEDFNDDEQRGVQVFTSSDVELFDWRGRNGWLDFFHSTGSDRVAFRRIRGDGTGQKAGRGGQIGAHICYASGDLSDVEGILFEDIEGLNANGAALQLNGDGQTISGSLIRRCRLIDFGAGGGGCAINLQDVDGVKIEDLDASSRFKTDGVRLSNASGVTLTRYSVTVPGKLFLGSVAATAGVPEWPRFDAAPPPPQPIPPTPDLAAQNAILTAQLAETSRRLGEALKTLAAVRALVK